MARTVVINPKGERGTLPDEVVDDYVKNKGYKVVTTAEDHPIKAALQGVARGASFGLSDYAAGDTPEGRRSAQALKDENPVASTLGNVVGSVATAIAAPEIAIGKAVAGKVAGMAIKNSLAGIGPQVSEAALTDKPINKELLAADMLVAGIAGTVVQGGATAAGTLVSRAAGKAGELAASDKVLGAANAIRAKVLKKTYGLDDDVFKFAEKEGLLSSADHAGVHALSSEAQRKAGYRAVEAADDLAERFPDLKPASARLKELLSDPNAVAQKGEMDALKKYFADAEVLAAKTPKVTPPAAGGTVNMRTPVTAEAPKPSVIAQSVDDFNRAKILSDLAQEKMAADLADGVVQPALMAGIFGGPKAGLGVAAAGVAKNAVSQRGGPMVARALEKISEGKVLPKVLQGFKAQVDTILQTMPGVLGPFAYALAGASAQGADALFAVHTSLAQSEQGGDYLARMGMTHETPEETAAYGQKLAVLEALETQRAAYDHDVDKHVSAFFKGGEVESPAATRAKDYEGKLEAIRKLLDNPQDTMKLAPGDVFTGAPALSIESGRQVIEAAQFLMDRAPKAPDAWKPKALQTPFVPAPGDIDKWMRFVRAVEDPKVASLQLAAGRVDPEAVEVMQALYPGLFAQVQTKVMAQLQSLKKPLPYAKQVALAQIFGPEIMGISPQQTMLLQTIHQSQTQPQQNPGQGPSQDGRQMVNTSKNMQTQTQRLEGRGQ